MTSVFELNVEWGTTVKIALIAIAAIALFVALILLLAELHARRVARRRGGDTPIGDAHLHLFHFEHGASVHQDSMNNFDIDPTLSEIAAAEAKKEPSKEAEKVSRSFDVAADKSFGISTDNEVDEDEEKVELPDIHLRYNRSFIAKLVQSDDILKGYYTALCGRLAAYGLNRRVSWGEEAWCGEHLTCAFLSVRGKSLFVYFALRPELFDKKKYTFTNVRSNPKYRNTPLCVKIKSDRTLSMACELVEALASRHNLEKTENPEECFRPDYRGCKALVSDGLIKLRYDNYIGRSKAEIDAFTAADIKIKDKNPPDYLARLMRIDFDAKARYSTVKNELIRFGLTPKLSKRGETFNVGKTTDAFISVRGRKALTLYLALNPDDYADTKIKFRDMRSSKRYALIPLRIDLKSDRALAAAMSLLKDLAEVKGFTRTPSEEVDYRYIRSTAL